jgi:hypothetical protein
MKSDRLLHAFKCRPLRRTDLRGMFESKPGPPSDSERLEAICQHTHRSLRYYATAFLNSDGEERDRMRLYLDFAANYMALIEGESLNERHAGSAVRDR